MTMDSNQPKRILVTGASGFIGSYLTEYLVSLPESHEVYGTIRWLSCTDRITDFPKQLQLLECDLTDYNSVFNIVNTIQPDVIMHLAGPSDVAASWLSPSATTQQTVTMQQNLIQAIRSANLEGTCRLVVALSGQEYGAVKDYELPIDENTPLRPVSPYGVAKVMQDMAAYQAFLGFGVKTIRIRMFNVTGPGQSDVFVVSNIAKQIAEAEAGMRGPKVVVGNLSSRRDWTDVRDVVKALWLAAKQGKPGEAYVVASGQSHSIDSVIERFKRLTSVRFEVDVLSHFARQSDIPDLVGNSRVFKELTYWEPQFSFEQTLEDILNAWRLRVKFLNRLGDIMRGFQQGHSAGGYLGSTAGRGMNLSSTAPADTPSEATPEAQSSEELVTSE